MIFVRKPVSVSKIVPDKKDIYCAYLPVEVYYYAYAFLFLDRTYMWCYDADDNFLLKRYERKQ